VEWVRAACHRFSRSAAVPAACSRDARTGQAEAFGQVFHQPGVGGHAQSAQRRRPGGGAVLGAGLGQAQLLEGQVDDTRRPGRIGGYRPEHGEAAAGQFAHLLRQLCQRCGIAREGAQFIVDHQHGVCQQRQQLYLGAQCRPSRCVARQRSQRQAHHALALTRRQGARGSELLDGRLTGTYNQSLR
jgi:hypothetical protein